MPSSPETLKPTAILVVDDHKNILRTIGFIFLDDVNFKVESAYSGNNAIQKIKSGFTPDVILTDITMPDGDGIDLHTWVSDNMPELADRLIFMTGNLQGEEMRSRAEEIVGKRRVLEKPLFQEDIRGLINEVLLSKGEK